MFYATCTFKCSISLLFVRMLLELLFVVPMELGHVSSNVLLSVFVLFTYNLIAFKIFIVVETLFFLILAGAYLKNLTRSLVY